MILNVDTGRVLSNVPHLQDYKRWVKALAKQDPTALGRIQAYLDRIADDEHLLTSSWIPGSDWHGTIFESLYHACNGNEVQAAQFYGLVLFDVMLKRSEPWGYGKYTTPDGRPIKGLTYFRLETV